VAAQNFFNHTSPQEYLIHHAVRDLQIVMHVLQFWQQGFPQDLPQDLPQGYPQDMAQNWAQALVPFCQERVEPLARLLQQLQGYIDSDADDLEVHV
jgi:hypothetical protein